MGVLLLSSSPWNIGKIKPYSWDLTEEVSQVLDYSWDIYEGLPKALSYSWSIEGYITKGNVAFSWNILNYVNRTLSYSWRILKKYSTATTRAFPSESRDKEYDATPGRAWKNTRTPTRNESPDILNYVNRTLSYSWELKVMT